MNGLVKKKEQVLFIQTQPFSKVHWKQWKKPAPYTIMPRIEWSLKQVHLIFVLDDYLFVDHHFEKNERQYNLSHLEV